MTKFCTACKQHRPLSEFYKNNSSKSGFQHYCKSCVKKYRIRYERENREAINKRAKKPNKKYRETKKNYKNIQSKNHEIYREKNKEALKSYNRKWKKENKEKVANQAHRRRARKINASANGNFTEKQWKALIKKTGNKCLCCEKSGDAIKLTIDHIVPISKGGENNIDNIQPLCLSCNASKGDKTINYPLDDYDKCLYY